MATTRVIKFARDDGDASDPILVQVAQKGSKALDVKLVGTEGEAAYVAILKHDRVASLQVSNCPVSESEWQSILQSLFTLQPAADIQATASAKTGTSLSITVRKRVQGITQRLGTIELKHDEDEGIELLKWCAESVDALVQSNAALAEAAAHAKELETTVKELKAQLDELVTSKQEDETALLHKFRDLLNEKKVKIREQQKVIAAGSFPNSSQQASQWASQTLDPQPSRTPAPSRPRKRKVQAAASSSKELENDEMDVDKIKSEPEDSEPELTPEDTADDTASGDGDGEEEDDADEDNEGSNISETRADDISKPAPKAPPKKANEQPPPPRNLPFTKKKGPAKPPAAGNETDSDDEL